MLLPVGEQPHYIHDFCYHCKMKKTSKTKNGKEKQLRSYQDKRSKEAAASKKARYLKEEKGCITLKLGDLNTHSI
jgi:hypothetical protein